MASIPFLDARTPARWPDRCALNYGTETNLVKGLVCLALLAC